jgi:Fe-S cluster assembly protein SufD
MKRKPQTPDIGPFLETFGRFESALQPAWLLPLRRAGIARFAELGFPTLQDEDWRFTNVAPLAKLLLRPVAEPANAATAKATLEKYLFARLPGVRLVFVNGEYSVALSAVHGLPDGVRVSNLAAAMVADSEFIKRQFSLYAPANHNAFTALNQAFFTDGGFVQVPAGISVADPIQIVFISTAKQDGETILPRNLIVTGANSKATIIESYISADNLAYFTNTIP